MGIQCVKVNADMGGALQEGMELPTCNVDELSNAIISTMRVELRIKCDGLPHEITNNPKSVLSYKIEYGTTQQVLKWSEKLDNGSESKFSNAYILPYELGTNKSMKISLYRHDDDARILYGNLITDLDDIITSDPHEIRKQINIVEEAYKDFETFIILKANEKKQENLSQLVLQFEIIDCKLKGPLYFTCYQKGEETLKFIYQSEMIENKKSGAKVFTFHPLMLSSKDFEGLWDDKILTFEFEDASKKKTKKPMESMATYVATIKELIQLQSKDLQAELRNLKFGKLTMKTKKHEPIITLGSVLFSKTRFIPIIAVDCSLGNLTFDNLKCMHHFDKMRPNFYIEALKAIEMKIKPFYSKLIAYGFGAKLVPKKSKPCDCFALNGNIFDPIIKTKEQLIDSYIDTIKSVEICLPVNFTKIIRAAKSMAQFELKDYKKEYMRSKCNLGDSQLPDNTLRNYYILYILTAGVIDDPDETFNECLNIPELPLSIVFVKIGNQQMKDVDDLDDLKKRLELYQSQRRKFMSLVEFDRVYNDLENFGKFLISTVPTQLLQFIKLAEHTASIESMNEESGSMAEKYKGIKVPDEDEKCISISQQGIDSGIIQSYDEYFDDLKADYYNTMIEKSVTGKEVGRLINEGVAEIDPDLPLIYLKGASETPESYSQS